VARGRIPWAGLALLAAGLFIFAALEAGFRVLDAATAGQPGESWATYDEDLAYRNRPLHGDHNRFGLRGPEPETPKRRFRLLVLGDSVPYYGDDAGDTYPGRLERILAADGAHAPVEVLNAATRGYTNYQELIWLKKYGLALEPDLVGVSFILNDLHRILHRFQVVNGEIVGQEYTFAEDAVQGVDSPLYRLARKSRFLVWLRGRLGVFDDLVDLYTRDGYSFDYRPDFNTAWQEGPWREVDAQLGELAALGRERGFRVFVVVFPFGEQLRADYLARDRAYVTLPQRRLAEIAAKHGIALLDLFDALDPERDLVEDRIHLTPHGRDVAARRIAAFLAEQGLLPLRG
jgi:lysophospholipase L1-like esterase